MAFVCGCFSVCSFVLPTLPPLRIPLNHLTRVVNRWAIIAASIITSVSQFCLAIAMAFHPSYEPQNWCVQQHVSFLACFLTTAPSYAGTFSSSTWL